MKTLVVCGGGSATAVSQHGPDARRIAWNDRGRSVLEEASLEYTHIDEFALARWHEFHERNRLLQEGDLGFVVLLGVCTIVDVEY